MEYSTATKTLKSRKAAKTCKWTCGIKGKKQNIKLCVHTDLTALEKHMCVVDSDGREFGGMSMVLSQPVLFFFFSFPLEVV